MQGKKPRQEKLFLSFQLSNHISENNFYRRLLGLLDLDFLYKLTLPYYGHEGQKSIDPVVFMKLMLVGYLENLNSDRRIIEASRVRMDVLYFIGYDIDEALQKKMEEISRLVWETEIQAKATAEHLAKISKLQERTGSRWVIRLYLLCILTGICSALITLLVIWIRGY